MASDSISSLILLIASLIVAGIVSQAMVASFSELSGVIDIQSDNTVNKVKTDIQIINDPKTNKTYDPDTNTLTLYVKNVGERDLENSTDPVDVLIDGKYSSIDSMTILEHSSWREGEVARLTFNVDLSSGYHRVKVILDGDEEVLEFYV